MGTSAITGSAGQRRVTAEIRSGRQPLEYPARKDRNIEMAGLLAAIIAGTCPGLMVSKVQQPFSLVGSRPKPLNSGSACTLRIVRMVVLPFRIGLPDLNHGIRYRNAITIKHANFQSHTLAFCFTETSDPTQCVSVQPR